MVRQMAAASKIFGLEDSFLVWLAVGHQIRRYMGRMLHKSKSKNSRTRWRTIRPLVLKDVEDCMLKPSAPICHALSLECLLQASVCQSLLQSNENYLSKTEDAKKKMHQTEFVFSSLLCILDCIVGGFEEVH